MEKLRVIIDDKGGIEFWMDGCVFEGIRAFELYWEVGEIPHHKLEFITHVTKCERKFSQG